MQLTIKTILNQVHPLKKFVYADIRLAETANLLIEAKIEPRKGSHIVCSGCHREAPGYDELLERRFEFIPLWLIPVVLLYTMRRVECPRCGVKVEEVPWACGKHQMAKAYMQFLAGWAKRLAWSVTAKAFNTTWDSVRHSIEWMVEWGLANRSLAGITAIGIDEIHWGRGKGANRFLTLVYQVDAGCRRLLWVGRKRTKATLRRCFKDLGPEVIAGLRFVCSDMWQPYLSVIEKMAGHALNILDPFHIVKKLNEAVDAVRREETAAMRRSGRHPWLINTRWILLKHQKNVRGRQRASLRQLLGLNLKTIRAYLLKEYFAKFWKYRSLVHAQDFFDFWTRQALQSRLEPMRKVARMLRAHEPLIWNWFKAKGQFSNAVVEGFNNKLRVVTRRSYSFRTYQIMELVLYHTLGELPEPHQTHRFC
ncbi:MAG: ISL3 family transposase [Verrucomicrobiae bacterium]|nr:ISL3 family transposase [Verrucomicrobiae bacterium]